MKFVSGRVVYSLLFFVLLMVLVFVSKPGFVFMADGSIKQYGVGEGKTVISMGVIAVVCAISSFYVFALLDLVFSG